MSGSTRFSLCIVLLLLLKHNEARSDECDPKISGGQEIKTYVSSIERYIQGLQGVISFVTGGDDDDENSKGLIRGTFSSVLDQVRPEVLAMFPGITSSPDISYMI